MERAVEILEQISAQIALAWELPPGRVMVDPKSSDQSGADFAILTPMVEFGKSNACVQSATLKVGIGGRFRLGQGSDALRQRAAKIAIAHAALSYSAATNPNVPRIGDGSQVTAGSLADPAEGAGDPAFYLAALEFETSFEIEIVPFVPPTP